MNRLNLLSAIAACALMASPAAATTWMIGDDDGFGAGIPNGADHPFNGSTANYDGRSAAEKLATNGAQYTDTYSTTHPGYSPHGNETSATFIFDGLGSGWTEGAMYFDMADFQASTFGAVNVTFNGITQDWAFNDGFPHTKLRFFNLSGDVVDSINTLGSLTIVIDRNNSVDFYGFDYAQLSDVKAVVPEPATWAMMIIGFGAVGTAVRRRRQAGALAA